MNDRFTYPAGFGTIQWQCLQSRTGDGDFASNLAPQNKAVPRTLLIFSLPQANFTANRRKFATGFGTTCRRTADSIQG